MIFKGYIEGSGAMTVMAEYLDHLGVPLLLLAIILPLFTGIATGSSLAGVGILFPIFIPLIPAGMDKLAFLSLVYVSIIIGYVISPVHMCLVLTREVCQARFGGLFPYLLPTMVVLLTTSILQVLI